jgi:DNA-binding response OmpR family regulator
VTTVLLAIGDPQLRRACRQQLRAAGHAAVALDRPLALLSLSYRLRWDALCIDDSELGRAALAVASRTPRQPVVGLGIEAEGTSRVLALPLAEAELLAAFETLREARGPKSIRLDAASHRLLVDEHEVRLSDIEFRLFRLLYERRPGGVSLEEAAAAVWGSASDEAGGGALRVHVRNLRVKLAAAGLPTAVQSRRGHGYALVL